MTTEITQETAVEIPRAPLKFKLFVMPHRFLSKSMEIERKKVYRSVSNGILIQNALRAVGGLSLWEYRRFIHIVQMEGLLLWINDSRKIEGVDTAELRRIMELNFNLTKIQINCYFGIPPNELDIEIPHFDEYRKLRSLVADAYNTPLEYLKELVSEKDEFGKIISRSYDFAIYIKTMKETSKLLCSNEFQEEENETKLDENEKLSVIQEKKFTKQIKNYARQINDI